LKILDAALPTFDPPPLSLFQPIPVASLEYVSLKRRLIPFIFDQKNWQAFPRGNTLLEIGTGDIRISSGYQRCNIRISRGDWPNFK